MRRLSNFQKTVTCVRLSPYAGPDSAAAPRMLAGSLDGHVKMFELDDFKVTHASKYPAPVMGLGLSADCSLLAVGMADGMLSVRKHARPKAVQVRLGMVVRCWGWRWGWGGPGGSGTRATCTTRQAAGNGSGGVGVCGALLGEGRVDREAYVGRQAAERCR